MKKLSKFLALLVALCMVLTVGAFASGEPSGDPSGAPSDEAPAAGQSVEEAYVDYIHEFLLNELTVNTGGMTIEIIENEFMPAVEAGKYNEFPADMLYNGMLDSGVAMTFEEFAAQYVPEAAAPASGEAKSAEDAYADYLREFLEAELAVNSSMMPEHVEEILAAALAGETDTFPGDILFNGMLVSGNAMTFEEFAAQYQPAAAAPAAGGYTADEAGYKAYLKDWVAANPAVQANIDEFNAGIDAGAYNEFPMEMCFTDQWFGFAALTLDEFLAAGGVAEIPAFDPNLQPD